MVPGDVSKGPWGIPAKKIFKLSGDLIIAHSIATMFQIVPVARNILYVVNDKMVKVVIILQHEPCTAQNVLIKSLMNLFSFVWHLRGLEEKSFIVMELWGRIPAYNFA